MQQQPRKILVNSNSGAPNGPWQATTGIRMSKKCAVVNELSAIGARFENFETLQIRRSAHQNLLSLYDICPREMKTGNALITRALFIALHIAHTVGSSMTSVALVFLIGAGAVLRHSASGVSSGVPRCLLQKYEFGDSNVRNNNNHIGYLCTVHPVVSRVGRSE